MESCGQHVHASSCDDNILSARAFAFAVGESVLRQHCDSAFINTQDGRRPDEHRSVRRIPAKLR